MQHLYEYGAMALEDFLHVIAEMRESRAAVTFPAEMGHVVALLVPGGHAE